MSQDFERLPRRKPSLLPVMSRDTLALMAADILVVTNDSPLGEFICQGLEETGRFNAHVTREDKEAITFLLETGCTLALIVTSDSKADILALGHRMRETRPALRIILITEHSRQGSLGTLSPEIVICKPFSLPELISSVESICPEKPSAKDISFQGGESMPPWLLDVNRAAQQLTLLSRESTTQAALIIENDLLWAYAGQLPQEAARELVETVVLYWDSEEQNDLVRFVQLSSTGVEHMLYATRLAYNKVLGLVFDADTPYSTIRSQAIQLIRSLFLPSASGKPTEPDYYPNPFFMQNILSDVPPPNPLYGPHLTKQGRSGKFSTMTAELARELSATRDENPSSQAWYQGDSGFSSTSTDGAEEMVGIDPRHISEQLSTGLQAASDTPATGGTKISREIAIESLSGNSSETAYGIFTAPRKIILEPVTGSVYNLDYVCLLLPRFTHHLLTGELADRLSDWVAQICIAFDWRLEYISIRPEYLELIANVPPSTSPAYLMRVLRRYTSEKIFLQFPRYKRDNFAGDFWAPGYLIMGGSQPPPPQLINEYISQSRQRQGLSQIYHR